MKKYLNNLIPAIPVALVLGTMIFSHSCANTTTPPSGGPKDTIPPVITDIYPALGEVNVPTHGTKLEIEFNEYVTVKDPKRHRNTSLKERGSSSHLKMTLIPTRHILLT